MADLREQLLAAFEVEHREHVDAMRGALQRARQGAAIDMREVFRRAHSLKGAARAVDLADMEDLAHALETLFAAALGRDGILSAAEIEEALKRLDAIDGAEIKNAASQPQAEEADPGPVAGAATEFLRVDAGQIQDLVAGAHELSAELDALDPDALKEALARLRAMARVLESAALQARRDPTLAVARLDAAAQEVRALSRSFALAVRRDETERWTLQRSAARLRDHITRVSMAPAGSVFAGLGGMVRELAREAGRDVEFIAAGMETQADRRLLQSLRDPVIQLLRNALAHSVEPPEARRAAGKPERATIGMVVSAANGQLTITVYDDGRGPDLARIARAARERGLLGDSQMMPLAPEAVLSLAFEPGFSTADGVDRIAGRGMGLSVVSEAARAAGGGAFMRARRPCGTEVVISTPLSAARQNLVLLRQGQDAFGLPSHALETIVQMLPAQLEDLEGRPVIRLDRDGNQVLAPVVFFDRIVGAAGASRAEAGKKLTIAVLRQDELRLGLIVDAVEDVRAATLTPVEHRDIGDVVAGAAQLERGEVALVLKPDVIFQRYLRGQLGAGEGAAMVAPLPDPSRGRTVLVVDDSVTTRTLEKSILEAQGYRVVLAFDGLDGLAALRNPGNFIDLIIADIEMPRLDGFQFLQAVKADAHLSRTPVILMTSRADPEDVRRGMELGADAYLVKQSFDQRELLATIRQLL